MTKTTTPKAPRLTKAQKAAMLLDMPALTPETILERAEVAQHNAEVESPPEDTTIAPVESDVNDLYVPLKKPMKMVKTVKTGVGAQILQHIADGVLSNKEIVAKVLEDNPLRKTTYACVAWYQSQVKAGKIDLPEPQEEVMMTEDELEQEGSEE